MNAQRPMTSRGAGVALPAAIAVRPTAADLGLHLVIVALTLATAAIHASLGGLLFLANAAGYSTLAVSMIVPLPLARRYRWLTRLTLLGFTCATIAGWLAIGARFPLAYFDKGLEAFLVGCLVTQMYRLEGSPLEAVRRLARLARSAAGRVTGA